MSGVYRLYRHHSHIQRARYVPSAAAAVATSLSVRTWAATLAAIHAASVVPRQSVAVRVAVQRRRQRIAVLVGVRAPDPIYSTVFFAVLPRSVLTAHARLVLTTAAGATLVVPVADAAPTWAVDDIGTFSGFTSVDHYLGTGLDPEDARGWGNLSIRFDHPTLGPWAGDVLVMNRGGSEVEIVGQNALGRLQERRTVPLFRPIAGSAGQLIYRAVVEAASDDAPLFASVRVDADGPMLTAEWRDDEVWQFVRRIAEDGGMRVWCDEDRNLVVRRRVGRDLRGTVRLTRGTQVLDVRAPVDKATIANDLVGVTRERDWERSARVRIEDLPSIGTWGRRQSAAAYPGTTPGAIEFRVRSDLSRLSRPSTPIEIDVADVERCWAGFREGDVLRLGARVLGVEQGMEVLTRRWSAGDGRLVATGTLVGLTEAA